MGNQNRHATRTAGRKGALVLEEMANRRARSLSVDADKAWLSQITPHYQRLLSRMEDARLLYRTRRGHYVVAPHGTFSAAQAAPMELIAARILDEHSDYFISHLTALIGHRLTDLHSSTIYATIKNSSSYREVEVPLPSGTLQVARISEAKWPADEGPPEVEEIRVLPDSTEFIRRATLERSLVDALARPDLCAGFETVISCWRRAKETGADWQAVCAIAARQGPNMSRRTSYLLRLLGLGAIAGEAFPDLTGRGNAVLLDRSRDFDIPANDQVRNRTTGVVVNVPPDYLLAWTGATSLT